MTKATRRSSRMQCESKIRTMDHTPKVRLGTENKWGVRFLPMPKKTYERSPLEERFIFDDKKLCWVEVKKAG